MELKTDSKLMLLTKKRHEIVIYELNFFFFSSAAVPAWKQKPNQLFLVNDFGVSFELWPEILTFPNKTEHMLSPRAINSSFFCGFLF